MKPPVSTRCVTNSPTQPPPPPPSDQLGEPGTVRGAGGNGGAGALPAELFRRGAAGRSRRHLPGNTQRTYLHQPQLSHQHDAVSLAGVGLKALAGARGAIGRWSTVVPALCGVPGILERGGHGRSIGGGRRRVGLRVLSWAHIAPCSRCILGVYLGGSYRGGCAGEAPAMRKNLLAPARSPKSGIGPRHFLA